MHKLSAPVVFGYVLISWLPMQPRARSQEVYLPGAHGESTSAQALPREFSGRDVSGEASSETPAAAFTRPVPRVRLPDFNRDIYYRNKVEFSLETGWLPNNIPFPFDFLVGDPYNTWPLNYTLAPSIASLRWHIDNVWGRSMFRGNTDMSFSGSYTAIPRGAETRYFAFDYGIRRNFVQPRWRVAPYFEGRGGIGNINAKGPKNSLKFA
jgi:hypothetical protein